MVHISQGEDCDQREQTLQGHKSTEQETKTYFSYASRTTTATKITLQQKN